MKKHLLFSLSSFLFLLLALNTNAQQVSQAPTLEANRTDNKPTYEQFNDQCILDKIEYQKDRTIFHFRYKAGPYSSIWLYSPEGAHPWFLKDKINNKEYDLIGVYNVRRNNRLKYKEVQEGSVHITADTKKEKTYFECEVHFERLPESVSEVDLIEGRGMETAWNHFNCFDIQINPLKEQKEAPVVAPLLVTELSLPVEAISDAIEKIEPAIVAPQNETTEKPAKKATKTLVEVVESSDWSVFPTPATDILNIQQTEAQEAQLTLFNINGQVIWTGRMQGTSKTIDVSELSTGAYFLQHTVAGTTTAQKVLIK